MKESDIDYVNRTICRFIQDMAVCQDTLLTEAPDVWECILSSMSMLSDVSVFLEAIKDHERNEDLDFINAWRTANNLSPYKFLPLKYSGKDKDIQLDKYKKK